MGVVVPSNIFWHLAGRHFTQIPAQNKISGHLKISGLPKEGNLRLVLTSPGTLWGQKQTGEKQQSSPISLLLLGLLVCELGHKGEVRASNFPVEPQEDLEGEFFLVLSSLAEWKILCCKSFPITWFSSSGQEGSWKSSLHCLSVQVGTKFSQDFSTSLQLQHTCKVPVKGMVRAQQPQSKADVPTRAAPSCFSMRVL